MRVKHDPTKPLPSDKEEAYCQERALTYGPHEAVRRAGLNPRNGLSTKFEAKPRVQARIAHLKRRDLTDEMLVHKRQQIAERFERAAYFSLLEFATENGIALAELKASEFAPVISELIFDKDTGKLTKIKRDDALTALKALCELYGFNAPNKTDITTDGNPLPHTTIGPTIIISGRPEGRAA